MPEEIACCHFCGRDTKARDGICSQCRGGRLSARSDQRGNRGRKQRDTRSTNASAIKPVEEDPDEEERASSQRYHGETPRDDL